MNGESTIQGARLRVAFLGIISLTIGGCGQRAGGDPEQPLSVAVVSTPGGGATQAAERAAAFDEWAREAMHRPGSTFEVLTPGHDRESWRCRLLVHVPESWGANALASKAVFLSNARAAASAPELAEKGVSLPADATGPTLADAALQRVMFLSSGSEPRLLLKPPTSMGKSTRETVQPLHEALVCDRSDSGLEMSCTAESLLGFYDRWLEEAVSIGGSFCVYIVGASRDDARRVFDATVPRLPPGEALASLLGARNEVGRCADGPPLANASAIAEAVHVAAQACGERAGKHRIAVLSDLRQVTPGRWNFEKTVLEPRAFVSGLAAEGLLADLRLFSVTACGVHHRRAPGAPPFDARLEEGVRAAWDAAFRAMGTEPHIFTDCGAAHSAAKEEP